MDSFLPHVDVSIIMPMRNAERFVKNAIYSLFTDEVSVQIIVVDDGSTDLSFSIVCAIQDNRVVLIKSPGSGISAALNAALDIATGEFICRCDSDDTFALHRLLSQVQFLTAHPEYGAVCGGFSMLSEAGSELADLTGESDADITDELNHGVTRTSLCTFLIRKSVLHEGLKFREFFRSAEDIDFQLRLGEVCNVFYKAVSVYNYRLRDGSITHTDGLDRNQYFHDLARDFQRQRKTAGQDDLQMGTKVQSFSGSRKKPRSSSRHAQEILIGMSWNLHASGQKINALRTGLRALLLAPREPTAWRSIAALLWKLPLR